MRVVYFDTETDGLRDGSQIIQLAAVAVDETDWREIDAIEMKLKFDKSQSEAQALEMNHYDEAEWAERALTPLEAVSRFSRFLEPHRSLQMVSKKTGRPYSVARLCGHNAATFDGPRLKALFAQYKAFLGADPRIRCTMQRAIWWFDERGIAPENFQLGTLCKYFNIPVGEDTHDALADVRLTVQLAKVIREQSEVSVAA